MFHPAVYLLASGKNGTLYLGVTTNLVRRLHQHRYASFASAFTCRYHIRLLVYYEFFDTVVDAIAREKQLKNWNRKWKLRLIEEKNPSWQDLSNEISYW